MATFTSHQTQNRFVSKLFTNKPLTQKAMFTTFRVSYSESAPSLAVVGVTGAVGQEFLSILSVRDFPYRSIKMMASKRSAGKQLSFQDKAHTVEELTEDSFDGVDIALSSAGGLIRRKFVPIAVEKGIIVVDNSSAFRMVESPPLGIPEVNPEAMSGIKVGMGKVALIAATPLFRHAKVKRMVVNAYQAASGAGAGAGTGAGSMKELELQTHESQRGPGGSVTFKAADNSIGPVTGPDIGAILIHHLPSDINETKDAMVLFCQNDIRCQVIEFSTEEQLVKKLSCSGQSIIIATDHGAGAFIDKIASCTSGVVIGVPMRASEVTGVPACLLGISPERLVMLVGANDAMGAARLAMSICAFAYPEARTLKGM